jgi:hypothetical protein
MADYMETLTAEETDALFEAAEYARKNRWQLHVNDELLHLNSAIRKLRRATMLVIQPSDD